MILYLAAPWVHRHQANQVAQQFKAKGHQIISRWHSEWADKEDKNVTDAEKRDEAEKDVLDVRHAEVVVLLNWEGSTGGMFVEQGIALALNIPVLVIGEKSNVFHYLPAVRCVSGFHEACIALAGLGS